jgi:hypothetical protein
VKQELHRLTKSLNIILFMVLAIPSLLLATIPLQCMAGSEGTKSIISGRVKDDSHGFWPLYATIVASAEGYSTSTKTDPVSGRYELELDQNTTYALTVASVGYSTKIITAETIADNSTLDVFLEVDTSCSAPGYTWTTARLNEHFNVGVLPIGWSVIGNPGWRFDNPSLEPNYTGGSGDFAIADGFFAMVPMDTELRTPVLDLSDQSTALLQFRSDFYGSSGDIIDVDVSIHGASGPWMNVWRIASDYRGPKTELVDISDIAPGQSDVMIRFHYYSPIWGWWWQIDDVALLCPPCVARKGGLVAGRVFDKIASKPLPDVTVKLGKSKDEATTDSEGIYVLFAPPGTHFIKAISPPTSGYGPKNRAVQVYNKKTTRANLNLDAGSLSTFPDTIQIQLEQGTSTTAKFKLRNRGKQVARFHLLKGTGVSKAFAVDVDPGERLISFTSDTPGTWTEIGSLQGTFFSAGDFLGSDYSKLYALNYEDNHLFTIDTTNGNVQTIGSSLPLDGEGWSGMTSSIDGILYASSTDCSRSTLYVINPETGAPSPIGEITDGACIIDIAMDADGDLYGLDIAADNLLRIDASTGAGTVIGPIGFNAEYAQGMSFDKVSGTLFLAAYSEMSYGELREVDTETGATTLVGPFPDQAEVDSLAFAPDVPWFSVAPTKGKVGPGQKKVFTVTLDATTVAIGTYPAFIRVANDTPYGSFVIPITMEVVSAGSLHE